MKSLIYSGAARATSGFFGCSSINRTESLSTTALYFSDRIGAFLDEKNAIEQSYVLEISSPGLDRVIKKDKDFEKFSGKAVKVRIKIAENGQRKFSGILKGLRDEKVAVQVGGTLKAFDRKNIDEVRLDDSAAVDFGEE